MSDPTKVSRRLVTVFAADVEGYSRLMGTDEVGTLNALKEHRRERIDPVIVRQNGRIFKTTGDGLLVEFASVVDAVGCAVAIQRAMLPDARHSDFAEGPYEIFSRMTPAREVGGDLYDVVRLDASRNGDILAACRTSSE